MINIRVLLIVYSYHNMNTLKVARAMARVLDGEVKFPKDVDPGSSPEFDLVGFGSGIYAADFHKTIHHLVDKIPPVDGERAFLFSTNGAPAKITDEKTIEKQLRRNHEKIKDRLVPKGFRIVEEFTCPGLNTNVFLKFFGGLNRGRPNLSDLRQAELFAMRIRDGFS